MIQKIWRWLFPKPSFEKVKHEDLPFPLAILQFGGHESWIFSQHAAMGILWTPEQISKMPVNDPNKEYNEHWAIPMSAILGRD